MLAATRFAWICLFLSMTSLAFAGETNPLPVASQRSWPMFGGSPTRNMVNPFEKNLPTDWSVEEGKFRNIRWVAELGKKTFGSPVIAQGKVFVGTNNANPRDQNLLGHRAVLM